MPLEEADFLVQAVDEGVVLLDIGEEIVWAVEAEILVEFVGHLACV